jgi:3-oxoacyl-[acyl-carrier protein] reductase
MDRSVIITGSTRGIGLATAAEFLKNGDRTVVFCRHRSHARQAAKRLASFGPPEDILALAGDVRRADDVKTIVRQCLRRFGSVDVLVNNAGVASYGPAEGTSERQWDDILDTNLKGTFLFMRQVLPVMKKQGRGTIVNISSAMGVEGVGYFSAYSASKFGVVGLTQAVAEETAGSGLRLYAVLPWAVNTTLLSGSDFQMDPSGMLAPEYVARRIFQAARGRRRSGALFKVYS